MKQGLILVIADKTAPSTEPHKTFGVFSLMLWLLVIVLYIVSVVILTMTYSNQVAQHIPFYSTIITAVLACIMVGMGLLAIHLLIYSLYLRFKARYIIACFLAAALFYGGSMTSVWFAVKKQVKAVSNKVEIESTTAKYDNKIAQTEADATALKTSYLQSIDSLKKRKVADWLVYSTNKTIMSYYKAITKVDSTAKADIQMLQIKKSYECNVLQAKADTAAENTGVFAFVLILLDVFCNFSLVWLQSMFKRKEQVYTLDKNTNISPKEPLQTTNVISYTNTTNVQNNTIINVVMSKVEKNAYTNSEKNQKFVAWLLTQPIETINSFKDQRGKNEGKKRLENALQDSDVPMPDDKSLCINIALKQLTKSNFNN